MKKRANGRKKQPTINLTKKYEDFFVAFPSAMPQKYTWAITGSKKTGAVYFNLFLNKDLVASTIIHPDGIDGWAIEYISTIAINYKNPSLEQYLNQTMFSL